MKTYKVIDLQKASFMDDTENKPMTLNELRSRFWSLDECRSTEYKYFIADYIREMWQVELEEIK
jgi:hypothetical protein